MIWDAMMFFWRHIKLSISGIVLGYKMGEDNFDVGIYLTDKKYRGLGLGTKTWTAALEGLGPNCNISLSSVLVKLPMYSKLGFNIVGPKFKTVFGVPDRSALMGTLPENVVIEELDKGCLDELRAYDLKLNGVDRFAIVKRYLMTCLGPILVAKKADQILGFATLNKLGNYHFFEPLYSDNKEVAKAFMRTLLKDVPVEDTIALDAFSENQEATELLKDLGITNVKGSETFFMFTGVKFDCQINKVYGGMGSCYPATWINSTVSIWLKKMKQKGRHFGEISVTGCTRRCHFDNSLCNQWRKWQDDIMSVSGRKPKSTWLLL